jgi:hypothetical protein
MAKSYAFQTVKKVATKPAAKPAAKAPMAKMKKPAVKGY